ncbi:MAG TPA: dicarboxylate/amino acid:cation symporter [Gemmatimonadales bacterium]|jgi:DAACS family dicarboxylate/amino acid:cation (Na+ or H+) symporter|nr:dicarboxylate/amino acid:cation symporter [Gemmatimonadales bacterium]
MQTDATRRRLPLHTKILLGLGLGAIAGITANYFLHDTAGLTWVVDNIANPVGQIFLRLLFMIVVPLIFCSITLGVASLGDIRRVGRVGGKTILVFVLTTAFAVCIGLALVNTVKPGRTISAETRSALLEKYAGDVKEKAALAESSKFGVNTFVNIIPRNPVAAAASGDYLALIFFSLVFGMALTMLPREKSKPVLDLLDGIGEAVMHMIHFAMKTAPVGVFGLIFSVTALFGVGVLKALLLFVLMVLAGLAFHQFVVLPLLARIFVGISPLLFIKRVRGLMITAFSTSSSNATLPTTIETAERNFGVPKEVAGFVLPLGATMNMNGTALFEGMTVLFLAQAFGLDLSLGRQLIVIGMSVITAIGTAGVPGGSLPLLMLVLQVVGVPPEGIAIIIGVDRILDMSRTVPNVTGDVLTSLIVTKSEGLPLEIPPDSAVQLEEMA